MVYCHAIILVLNWDWNEIYFLCKSVDREWRRGSGWRALGKSSTPFTVEALWKQNTTQLKYLGRRTQQQWRASLSEFHFNCSGLIWYDKDCQDTLLKLPSLFKKNFDRFMTYKIGKDLKLIRDSRCWSHLLIRAIPCWINNEMETNDRISDAKCNQSYARLKTSHGVCMQHIKRGKKNSNLKDSKLLVFPEHAN